MVDDDDTVTGVGCSKR